jgi:predicted Zn finger-like uncharacterized protein
MHTRCPECHTTFKVTQAQLEAREGLVRCGRCACVFSATEHLVAAPAPRKAASRRVARAALEAGPAAPTRERAATPAPARAAARRRIFATVLWSVGSALLVAFLAGQFVYFYSSLLARDPALRPAILEVCAWLGCEIGPAHDVRLIELAETTIAPHPRYLGALRIRAALVNRAPYPQPLPLMEVTLTDSQGKALARRHFKPADYLEPNQARMESMAPNVVVAALLDVTTPDEAAVGYEIQLVTP